MRGAESAKFPLPLAFLRRSGDEAAVPGVGLPLHAMEGNRPSSSFAHARGHECPGKITPRV